MKKYRVKTIPEMLNTPGVTRSNGILDGPGNTFEIAMQKVCGEIIELSPPEPSANSYNVGCYKIGAERYHFTNWMLTEVTKQTEFKKLYEKLSS